MGGPLKAIVEGSSARWLARTAFALITGIASVAVGDPTVILISMDGTRPADLAAGGLPVLERVAREGATAARLTPVYPVNTFPNHVTFATGVSPERHGIVNNVFVDPERGRYSYDGDPTWLEAEPLWSIAAAHGVVSASFYWVGSEGPWRSGRAPRYWKPFSNRTGAAEKVDQILAWLALPEPERPHLVTAWFHGADGAGHRHGPGAKQVSENLGKQDVQLGRLLAALDAEGGWADTTLMLVSDHGMLAIEDSVNLPAVLEDAGVEATVHGGGGFATVTLEGGTAARARATEAAREHGLEAWARGEGPEGLESRHRRFGDLVVMAPPGRMISRSGPIGRLRAALTKGGHGYRPEEPAMSAIFLAMGRGVSPGLRLGEVRALDVAPTVLTLLGLPVPDTMEGRPIDLAPREAMGALEETAP